MSTSISKPGPTSRASRVLIPFLIGLGIAFLCRIGVAGDDRKAGPGRSSAAPGIAVDGTNTSGSVSTTNAAPKASGAAMRSGTTNHPTGVDPVESLERLKVGNYRYVQETPQNQLRSIERAKPLSTAQHPFAIVVGCADSRVSPEILFDQGIGDLFVIRMAGNVVQEDVIASIEYAVEHLGTRLVVLLGHERCGAVAAAMSNQEKPGEERGHLGALLRSIYPSLRSLNNSPTALRCFDTTCTKGTNEVHAADALFCRFCGSRLKKNEDHQAPLLESLAVRSNVRVQIEMLRHSEPVLKPLISSGRVKVVGACYDLDTGTVEFF